jgi:hypothetical protein
MTIYPFRGPLVRPSTESAQLDEQERDEDENHGGDGSGGEESADEEDSDSFTAAEGERSRKLARALGARAQVPLQRRDSTGVSVLSIRVKKK